MAYGTAILARAAGVEVVGVDIAGPVLDAVRPSMPSNVELREADLTNLPYPDASFDTIVSFELIEHVDEPEQIVKELARVLRADGVLIISTPNAAASLGQNPHHHHEMDLDEFRGILQSSLSHVEIYCQSPWVAVGVLPSDVQVSSQGTTEMRTTKIQGQPIERATYYVAVASRQPSSVTTAPGLVLTTPAEIDKWTALWDEQLAYIHELEQVNAELRRVNEELREARWQLTRAQTDAARAPILELELEVERERAQYQLGELRAVIADQQQQLEAILGSTSWRFTAPVRRFSGRVKGQLGE
jgi:SAM-dependent methyltransferase